MHLHNNKKEKENLITFRFINQIKKSVWNTITFSLADKPSTVFWAVYTTRCLYNVQTKDPQLLRHVGMEVLKNVFKLTCMFWAVWLFIGDHYDIFPSYHASLPLGPWNWQSSHTSNHKNKVFPCSSPLTKVIILKMPTPKPFCLEIGKKMAKKLQTIFFRGAVRMLKRNAMHQSIGSIRV